MMDYRYAHNLKELNELTSKGYQFLAVVDPNTFLMVLKEDGTSLKCQDCEYVAKADTEGKAKNTLRLHSKKHNGLGTDQTNN